MLSNYSLVTHNIQFEIVETCLITSSKVIQNVNKNIQVLYMVKEVSF